MPLQIRTSRLRHLRRSQANNRGLARGTAGVRRLYRLASYLSDRATDLTGTGQAQVYTAVNGTNRLTLTGHGYSTGNGPFTLTNDGGEFPTGLFPIGYWVSVVDVNTLQLHESKQAALQGISIAEFTTNGTGTNSIVPLESLFALFQGLKGNNFSIEELRDATDIDTLVD